MTKHLWKARWAKVGPLGRGGHGFAYLVKPLAASTAATEFVLKDLIKQKDPERRARMHREVASLETLDHPGVARLVESNARDYKEDVELYIITEFIPGENLEASLKKNRPSLEEAVAMVLRILDTVEYCHARGVIHRDLKPDNVILRNNRFDNPVIIDFGQSFNFDDETGTFSSDPEQQVGNRFVILPEFNVVGEDKRDRISDITQIVGLLFFAMTGVVPGHMEDSQIRKPQERPPGKEQLQGLSDKVLRQANRIFEVGFSNEKLRRWQTIPALRAEVKKLLSPDQRDARPFADRIGALKQRLAETPTYALIDRVDQLTKFVVAAFEDVWNRLYGELTDKLRDAAYGVAQSGKAPNQQFRAVTFKTKYDPNAKFSLSVYGSVEDGEYILWGVRDGAGETELLRFGLFDPAASEIIPRSVEDFVCGQIEAILS
jgi:eukaryotic-like serine/threonine-protein kinase